MTNNADITIFNLILGEDRREIFVPTTISGVSWYEVRSLSQSGENREPRSKFTIRIPIDAKVQNNRTYIPEELYRKLKKEDVKKYWTIQKNSYIIKQQMVHFWTFGFDQFSFRSGFITELLPDDINQLRSENEDFVTVIEYSDNTVRGSESVKHWRIGGA